ncbi:MAG: CSLREA domain-containing protein, partial [Deltaproteobacteria bacterium]|nr:CSLREA domain-containing protein [Deltaproteobacteria bacterium]
MPRSVLHDLIVCFVLLPSLFCPMAWAATITVDTTADDLTTNGNCTLREAIRAAEFNTAVDTCTAGDDNNDTIDLASVNGTISLGAVLPTITKDLTITGPGASRLTVDGNGISGVFDINSSTNDQTLTISGLTVTGGNDISSGGGFFVGTGDTLNLSSCVIDNNRAPQGGGI